MFRQGQSPADLCPYDEAWMDSCFQETLLPNSPWYQIEDKLCKGLAKNIEPQLNRNERRQLLFEILGPDFVSNYFPQLESNPAFLELPNVPKEKREELEREGKRFVHDRLVVIANKSGYQEGETDGSGPPDELQAFYKHTRQVFYKGLNRKLYLQEKDLLEKKKQEIQLQTDKEKKAQGRQKDVRDETLAGSLRDTASSSTNTSSDHQPSTAKIRESLYRLTGDPPQLCGHQSEFIGQSLIKILHSDPHRLNEITERLKGNLLPTSLRKYVWLERLLVGERKNACDGNVEKLVRERFARTVARRVGEMKIKRATHSPISGLIENAVIEFYETTHSMMPYNNDTCIKQCCRVLNVMYVYNNSYQPHYTYWLYPLQLAFHNNQTQVSGEDVYELAMYLDLLMKYCLPTWPQVFSAAQLVMNLIKQDDTELYHHIKQTAAINCRVQAKDFLVHLVNLEKAEAGLKTASASSHHSNTGSASDHNGQSLHSLQNGSSSAPRANNEVIADPVIFLRKWIGEVFVGVLDTASTMFVWDQLFIQQNWDTSVLVEVAVSIVFLLRHKFMEAEDYTQLKSVFTKEPCKLYTKDIRQAWLHVHHGGSLTDLPAVNRHNIKPESPSVRRKQSDQPARQSAAVSSVARILTPPPLKLKSVGVRNITLSLVMPERVFETEPWTANLETERFDIQSTLYMGDSELIKLICQKPMISAPVTEGGEIVYKLQLPYEVLLYKDIEIGDLDLENDMGSSPHVILQVSYTSSRPTSRASVDGMTPSHSRLSMVEETVTLGWTDIAVYDLTVPPPTDHCQWKVKEGEATFTLHPGKYKRSDDEDEQLSLSVSLNFINASGVLTDDSTVSVLVFDPDRHSTPTPIPSLTPVSLQSSRAQSRAPSAVIDGEIDDIPSWVEHRPTSLASNLVPTTTNQPFDIYVDSLHFVPDNTTIVKVTGRLLRVGQVIIDDILAMPESKSSARCPGFSYRLPVDTQGHDLDPNSVAYFRVYTVDNKSRELVIVGACLLQLFETIGSNKAYLRFGGHQLRLHQGSPVTRDQDFGQIEASDLDTTPVVPAASMLVRLLPHSQKFEKRPTYKTGYYKSDECKPNESEQQVIDSFKQDQDFPKHALDMIKKIYRSEAGDYTDTPEDWSDWARDRLDRSHLADGQVPGYVSLAECVNYRQDMGLNIQIQQVYGLQEGMYIQCYVRLQAGSIADELDESSQPSECHFLTELQDMNSLQKSPVWIDEPTLIKPTYDERTILVVRIYGTKSVYKPTSSHQQPGQVKGQTRLELLGWTLIPVFASGCVSYGRYNVPILRNRPEDDLLKQLKTTSVEKVLSAKTWTKNQKYDSAGLIVSIMDGHFVSVDYCPTYQNNDKLLEIIGDPVKYQQSQADTKGSTLNQFVLNTLSRKDKNLGTSGPVYQQEEKCYQQVMHMAFKEQLELVLQNAGYGSLS